METDLEFVRKMQDSTERQNGGSLQYLSFTPAEIAQLLRLAETAALIGEHRLDIFQYGPMVSARRAAENHPDCQWFMENDKDLHTAVRAVVQKIQEGK